jgi:hypothetical protein
MYLCTQLGRRRCLVATLSAGKGHKLIAQYGFSLGGQALRDGNQIHVEASDY